MRVFLAHNTLRQILKMPYYRVNHSDDITWREDDVTFVVVMASHIAPGGLSDFVFTNGRQKDLSKKIVTTGMGRASIQGLKPGFWDSDLDGYEVL